MKKYGLFTTNAITLIHLHPIDPEAPTGAVYWYRVAAMLKYVELTKPPPVYAFSKDAARTRSGVGFLVPKNTYFISGVKLPPRYCAGHDWPKMTDREKGLWGEEIIAALLDHSVIPLTRQVSISARTTEEQYASIDGTVVFGRKLHWEGKTETAQSNNLFVQTHEGGHKPNFLTDGVERVTALLPLFKGR